jgi:hypothetical protein
MGADVAAINERKTAFGERRGLGSAFGAANGTCAKVIATAEAMALSG